MPEPTTIPCPAKLNLALSVGRPVHEPGHPHGGRHPIASWMVALEWGDTLKFEPLTGGAAALPPREALKIEFAGDAPPWCRVDWRLEDDLAWRAWRAVEAEVGRPLPGRAELVKRVPPGSGMGGGSADAAAMLVSLNRAFSLGLEEAALFRLASELGSDVAFTLLALRGHPAALVTGLGNGLNPSRWPGPCTWS